MSIINSGVLGTAVSQVKTSGDAKVTNLKDVKDKYDKAYKTASELKTVSDGTAATAVNAKKALDDAQTAYNNAKVAYDKQPSWSRSPFTMMSLNSVISIKKTEYDNAARTASNMKTVYDNAAKVASDLKAKLDTITEGFTTQEPEQYDENNFDDYVFQFFIGSVSVVGLFVLFRIIQKNK
jgi:hypothetical protein